jgi:prepilin-type N-terminal cleavage/methylation domain-containing protein
MGNNPSSHRHGFTLIELMLVMVLLVIVISLVTPRLEKFFTGRALDSEVRQFVSLTRYGQSRAVSEGVPMVLWVNPKTGTYGLRQETGYTDGDNRAMDYTVSDGLTINVDGGLGKSVLPGKEMGIHFSPEGTPVTATSVKGVSIAEAKRAPVWIRQTTNGLSYEVQ